MNFAGKRGGGQTIPLKTTQTKSPSMSTTSTIAPFSMSSFVTSLLPPNMARWSGVCNALSFMLTSTPAVSSNSWHDSRFPRRAAKWSAVVPYLLRIVASAWRFSNVRSTSFLSYLCNESYFENMRLMLNHWSIFWPRIMFFPTPTVAPREPRILFSSPISEPNDNRFRNPKKKLKFESLKGSDNFWPTLHILNWCHDFFEVRKSSYPRNLTFEVTRKYWLN